MKKKFLIFIFILISICMSVVGLYFYEINEKKEYDVQINLKSGMSLNTVFNRLKLNDSIFFKIYLRLEKISGTNVKAGIYNFKGMYSYEDIINILEEGKVTYKVLTIPEGYSIKELGKLVEEKGFGTTKGLEQALANVKDFPYLTPNGNFEGYLYPETYYLSVNTSETEIVNRMLSEFLKKFPPDQYKDKEDFYKKLIMASIIEREAQLKDEKPLMASVFYNRLKKGMTLGSDATVNYIYDYGKRRLYYKDLKIDSPYNTYMYKGLPPGPISNPDYNSVMAAINPAQSDYLFFVVTSAGKHTFTKTYKEHLEVQKKKTN